MVMPTLVRDRASRSIVAKRRVNRIGASTQLGFTPFVTGKGSDRVLFSITLATIPSRKAVMMLMNF